MTKFNTLVSSKAKKQRKNHFSAPSSLRRKLMSATLDKKLREKHNVRALPIRRKDEVQIISGKLKGSKGVVKGVYRKKFKIYVEGITKTKNNGKQPYDVPLEASNVKITKIHLDKDRRDLLKRKSKAKVGAKGEKYSEETVEQQ